MLVWNRKSPQSLSFEFEPWLYSDAHGVPAFLPTVPEWQLSTLSPLSSVWILLCVRASPLAHSSVPVAERQQQNDWACCASACHVTALCGWMTFPRSPTAIMFYWWGCWWKERVSSLPPGAGSTHSQQSLLGTRRHDCVGRQRESDGEEDMWGSQMAIFCW